MKKKKTAIDYNDPKVKREILIRQRRGMWTPEQIASFVKHFRLRPGMRLLDAGCGHGYAMRTFGHYCMPGGVLLGFDIGESLLKTARQNVRREKLDPASCFVSGNVYVLPFPDNSFDITIVHVLLCHLSEPERAFEELTRVTRHKGCLAIFDNAVAGGGYFGWANHYRQTIRQKLVGFEVTERMIAGRKKLGQGDYNVACYIPGWMERRGFKNVDARCNERVTWVAPPYTSPSQRTAIHNMRERIKEKTLGLRSPFRRRYVEQLRAGGATQKMIRNEARRTQQAAKKYIRAVRNKTIMISQSSGGFWCVWGFKP